MVTATVAILGTSAGLSIPKSLDEVRKFSEPGALSMGSPEWADSETLAYAKSHLAGMPVFSNVSEVLYLYANINVRGSTPAKGTYMSNVKLDQRAEFADLIRRSPNATIVWLEPRAHGPVMHPYLFDLDELKNVIALTPLAHFPDGNIYSARAITSPASTTSHSE